MQASLHSAEIVIQTVHQAKLKSLDISLIIPSAAA